MPVAALDNGPLEGVGLKLLGSIWTRVRPRGWASTPARVEPAVAALACPGGVEAVFAVPSGPDGEFFRADVSGARQPLPHEPACALAADIDILRAPDQPPQRWRRRGGGPKARSGINFAEGWRLPDADTAFLRTQGKAGGELVLHDPGLRLATGGYRLSLLAGVHRCRAAVVVELTDIRGQVVQVLQRGVSPTARGGRERAGYDHVEIAFEAPEAAVGLTLKVRKGGGSDSQDSFLFVAEPRLLPDAEAVRSMVGLAPATLAGFSRALRAGARLKVSRLGPAVAGTAGAEQATLVMAVSGCEPVQTPMPAPAGEAQATALRVSPLQAAAAWNRREDAVPRRIAAHRAWLRRNAGGESLPDLDSLASLMAGATPVAALTFPPVDAPDATVILHGDDPALLLRSLAALRFAANAAEVEIVVAAEAGAGAGLQGRVTGVHVAEAADSLATAAAGRADHLVLLQAGLEPVAGWADELLAAFSNFPAVGAVGGKVIASDAFIERAGGVLDAEGQATWIGAGGGPRDPAFGYVRPIDVVSPVMATAALWRGAAERAPGALDAAVLCSHVRQSGLHVLYVPTAEFWRLEPSSQPAPKRWPRPSPDRDPTDRPALPRVLFIDQEAPTVDMDAGGYASFQEMRLLQAAGCRVDFFPKNLAWMDRHTLALERAGVRCIYAPFARDFDGFLRRSAADYAAIFTVRYKVARLVHEALQPLAHRPRLILNLADLHFLREEREAAAGTPGFTPERALETRTAELAAIAGSDLTLTYSPVEAAVIADHAGKQVKVGKAPWTAEVREQPAGSFASTSGLLFLGGFGHPPNAQAAVRFVSEVMPRLAEPLPGAVLRIVGSKPTPEVLALAAANVEVVGYVADLDEAFARARVFVAPLLAGAGLKGKVVEAMARGVPAVLTSIAAEATGLVDGVDCLIAEDPQAQAQAIVRLYTDEALWTRLARASLEAARRQFGFDEAVQTMRAALRQAGIDTPAGPHLHYTRARPDPAHGASAAPAVLRLP